MVTRPSGGAARQHATCLIGMEACVVGANSSANLRDGVRVGVSGPHESNEGTGERQDEPVKLVYVQKRKSRDEPGHDQLKGLFRKERNMPQ
jgi:hypothetical protein